MTDRAHIEFYDIMLKPDHAKTVVRPFEPGYPSGFDDGPSRTQEVVDLICGLDDVELGRQLVGVTASLDENHRGVDATLMRRFNAMAERLPNSAAFSPAQQRLIGAYFSQEYAYEAAALFNPSAVLHPDQDGVPEGSVRFIISLRGIGEGHVSSVTFRTGVWTPGGDLVMDTPGPISVPPIVSSKTYENGSVLLDCSQSRDITETVLFPILPSQRQGIEDMRLVRFVDDDGQVTYHGTFTAFSGADARSELISTSDFSSFEMRKLGGDVATAKGMALFPRRIDGRYATIGRQDGKNLWLNYSSDLLHWDSGAKLLEPRYPWEFVQIGNCGSPIEIDEGWLVMTHGVGTVRNYCIGACLLDKIDPSKVLARTPRPVLAPSPKERDGYVPNVVYSCGSLLVGRTLLLPYAVADTFTSFGSLTIDNLLSCME